MVVLCGFSAIGVRTQKLITRLHPDWQSSGHARAMPWGRFDSELSTQQGRTLAHSGETVVAIGSRGPIRHEASSTIVDLDGELQWISLEPHCYLAYSCVAGDVCQRLLHDAISGGFHLWGEASPPRRD
jgi:hypothetical protein